MIKKSKLEEMIKELKLEHKAILQASTNQVNEIVYLNLLRKSIYYLKEIRNLIFASSVSKVIK